MRQFRDNWLAKQPNGAKLIEEYYRIAPAIVERLNGSDQRDSLYRAIWSRYILPCVSLAEQNSYESCRTRYETMVQDIKHTILKES